MIVLGYYEQLCQQTGQSRRNGEIIRNIQFTNTEQEEIENLNKPITSKEIELMIPNLPTTTKSETDCVTGEFYQTLKEEVISLLLKSEFVKLTSTHT